MAPVKPLTLKPPEARELWERGEVVVRRKAPQPYVTANGGFWYGHPRSKQIKFHYVNEKHFLKGAPTDFSPFGPPGTVSWVRETFSVWDGMQTSCGEEWEEIKGRLGEEMGGLCVEYKADSKASPDRWRPSIHMPRWASRMTASTLESRIEQVGGEWFWVGKLRRGKA